MNVSEDRINLWARPISETEEEKCSHAINQITEAVRKRFGNTVRIIHQGSHRNRTNVRADSDVDLAAVYTDSYFSDITALAFVDQEAHWNNLIPATYSFDQYKQDVHQLLQKEFGLLSVNRKNKCIRVEGNTYRVPADVVPAFVSNRYGSPGSVSHEGVGFIADNDSVVKHSFPDHHYASGVRKNDQTKNVYKVVVRVLKNARNEMVEKNLISKDLMPSFFLECLVWNAPEDCFQNPTYREDARSVAAAIWSHMNDVNIHKNYKEVSELEWLLRQSHRTPVAAGEFMLKVFHYLEAQ